MRKQKFPRLTRGLALLMFLILLLSSPFAGAESAPGGAVDYLYTFVHGTILEGEGTQVIQELLDAVTLRLTRQARDGGVAVRLQLESEGEIALSLSAQESADGDLAIGCSLIGNNVLVCRRDQLSSFLQTLVQVLADLRVLNGESLEKVRALAVRAAELLERYLTLDWEYTPQAGLDLTPYMNFLSEYTSETEERPPTAEESAENNAARVVCYLLSEDERRELVELALSKLSSIPALGNELKSGRLRIGEQVITDDFIRQIFADLPGEMSLETLLDSEERLVKLVLHVPDLSSLVTDERFSQTRGVELAIFREPGEDGRQSSMTHLNLLGLEGSLLSVRLDRFPAQEDLPPVTGKHIHQVGEMDSEAMLKLIRSMGLTIAGNAMNMFLTLPKCVFDLAVDKLFH